jgi:hypothetical protein
MATPPDARAYGSLTGWLDIDQAALLQLGGAPRTTGVGTQSPAACFAADAPQPARTGITITAVTAARFIPRIHLTRVVGSERGTERWSPVYRLRGNVVRSRERHPGRAG